MSSKWLQFGRRLVGNRTNPKRAQSFRLRSRMAVEIKLYGVLYDSARDRRQGRRLTAVTRIKERKSSGVIICLHWSGLCHFSGQFWRGGGGADLHGLS